LDVWLLVIIVVIIIVINIIIAVVLTVGWSFRRVIGCLVAR
jgi:hypothetical protein